MSYESHHISHAGFEFAIIFREGTEDNFLLNVFHCISFANSTSHFIAFQ